MKEYQIINIPGIRHNIIQLNDVIIGDIFRDVHHYLSTKSPDKKKIIIINLIGYGNKSSPHFFKSIPGNFENYEGEKILFFDLYLFPNIELAVASEDIGDCLNMRLYSNNGKKSSHISWINSKEGCDYIEKDVRTFINISEQINSIFRVKETFLSDEAKISCFDFDIQEKFFINLSITYIFKYGKTYYEKFGYKLNFEEYSENGEMVEVFDSSQKVKDFFKEIRERDPKSLVIPLDREFYKTEDEYTKIITIYENSRTLGEFFSKILNNKDLGCYIYYIIFENMLKNNGLVRRLKMLVDDTSSFYHKVY